MILLICKGLNNNTSGINTFFVNLKEYIKYDLVDLNESENINFKKYNKIILNCFDSLFWYMENKNKLKNIKIYYYTHIGDLLHSDFENYDFDLNIKLKAEKILMNENIIFLTQTKFLKKYIIKKYKKKCFLLKEPLSKKINIKNEEKKFDFIIISSYYKRKNLEYIIKKLSKYKLLFLTNDNLKIKEICLKYKLKNFIIYKNIKNDKIFKLISQSKCSINFSFIEVCPYGLLESIFFTNIIVNKNTIWGSCFFENKNVYKLKNLKVNGLDNIIKNNNFYIEEYKNYIIQTEKEWRKFEKY